MSVLQQQNSVNKLDKEIAELEKKKSVIDKKISDFQNKIVSANKAISNTKNASTINSKLKQINGWNSDIAKNSKECAELSKKIADRKKKRNEAYTKLQKAQTDERVKQQKELDKLQESYESQINELQNKLVTQVASSVDFQQDYLEENYDVFISHAWEDKEDFVDEFVNELKSLGLKVWYDSTNMLWGDPIREKIDQGLRKSKFGVVVLSPNYIAEGKYWTKTELNGLFQVETINGKTILPIWHKLTKKQVISYSPIIADRKALNTASLTAQEIAIELKKLLDN